MTSYSFSPVAREVVIGSYRNLSENTRKHISPERIQILLGHKRDYFMGLTYSQKCKVTTDRIVSVVQRRLQKNRIYLVKSIIRLALQAEEQFYVQQFSQMEEEGYDVAA